MPNLETHNDRRPERGPTARRGRQFANVRLAQLMLALNQANATMRQIRNISSPRLDECAEVRKLRALSQEELSELRMKTSSLQTDLRAELRRRNHL